MEKKIYIWVASVFVAVILLISAAVFINLKISNSYDNYIQATEQYNNSDFEKAKKNFKKITLFSPLKPMAIFREALCANKLEKTTEEIKLYNKLKRYHPRALVTPRAIYTEAKIHYQQKQTEKALQEFKLIVKRYPDTKYALASNYYIAQIDSEKYKDNPKKEREILNRIKKYLLEAPDGLYALKCAQLTEKYTLSDEEKILVGQVYLNNNDYEKALQYFEQTDISLSWPYLVQIYFTQKNYEKVQNFTKMGLSQASEITTKNQINSAYKAIDLYIKTFKDTKTALNSLLNNDSKNQSYDYIMYKNCQNSAGESQNACYNAIYKLYPNGNFAAESLANVFLNRLKNRDYQEALRLGKLHLMNYQKTKSSPKVIYWLYNTYKEKNNDKEAHTYYEKLMREYPDDYYTYLAFTKENKMQYILKTASIEPEPVEFPYADTKDKNLQALLQVEDYGLINMFYEDDGFVKSWILYQSGDYTNSSRLARDTMDKLEEKPAKEDLRWRLVYPVHYYEDIEQNSTSATDKTLMLSIIREESYFNANAKSPVGAMGLMQLMPSTANEIAEKVGYSLLNKNLLYDPKVNIKLGTLYFAYIKSLLSGKNQLAVLAYNGGFGAVKKWQKTIDNENFENFIENIPYSETQNYYKKVYRTYWNYLRIYNGIKF